MTHTKHKEIMDIRMKSVLYGTQDLQQIAKIDRLIQTRLLQQLEELDKVKQDVKDYINGLDSLPWEEQVEEDVENMFSHIREKKEVYKKQ